VLHQHVLDHYYRQQKLNLEYSENNVSKVDEFYPKKKAKALKKKHFSIKFKSHT
jgi:hypothetical protein